MMSGPQLVILLGLWSMADAGKVLLYPYGHCFTSHLFDIESIGRILVNAGHDVHMIVNTRYFEYAHIATAATNQSSQTEPDTRTSYDSLQDNRTTPDNFQLHIFDAPTGFKPICEYDTIDFMLYTPMNVRFKSFIETGMSFTQIHP